MENTIIIDGVQYIRADSIKSLKKWEPKGGKFAINSDGSIDSDSFSLEECRNFWTEYQTEELAEKASKAMRIHNRLLAYQLEFCSDYNPDWEDDYGKYYIYYSGNANRYIYSYDTYCHDIGKIYFPEHIAEELCEKLNSWEVKL